MVASTAVVFTACGGGGAFAEGHAVTIEVPVSVIGSHEAGDWPAMRLDIHVS